MPILGLGVIFWLIYQHMSYPVPDELTVEEEIELLELEKEETKLLLEREILRKEISEIDERVHELRTGGRYNAGRADESGKLSTGSYQQHDFDGFG